MLKSLYNKVKHQKKVILLPTLLLVSTLSISQCNIISGIMQHGDKILSGIEAIDKVAKVVEAYSKEFTPMEEYYIGRTVAASLLKKRKAVGLGNTPLEKYIAKIGHTLAMASDRPETYQGYRFVVLRSKSINAFAVPSGYIFVTTKLIRTAKTEDELAGALAHEVSHVVLRHPLTSISDAQKSQAVGDLIKFGAGTALSQQTQLKNLTGLFGGIIDEVNKSVLNGYDEEKEKEADLASVKLMINAGYNPKGLSAMLRKLKVGGGVHGDPKVRAAAVDLKITSYGDNIPAVVKVRTKRFKRMVKKAKRSHLVIRKNTESSF